VKLSFIIYSNAKLFVTNSTIASTYCNSQQQQQLNENVVSISPINGISSNQNLITTIFSDKQVIFFCLLILKWNKKDLILF
jgi:hypothetical protein